MKKSLIVSVSPNTSTDRVAVVDQFVPGEPSRTLFSFDQAGGSGAHATGVVRELGGDARSIVLLGGYNRDRWIMAAEEKKMAYEYVEMETPNRSTFVLIDRQLGNVAEVIDAGPQVPDDTASKLLSCIEAHLHETALLILSGSLPPGIPSDFYVNAIELARKYNVESLVDASNEPLKQSLKVKPWAIKPNLFEFHQIIGFQTKTLQEHIKHLKSVAGEIAEVILLSLGSEGILVAAENHVWHLSIPNKHITLPDSNAVNTTGCGDALVGGFSYAYVRSANVLESARWGIASATATLGTYGVPACPPEIVKELVEKVNVQSF